MASLVRDGYSRTTVSHVARSAGVPRPLVQYYFPTRELLLRAAIRKIIDDWNSNYLDPDHDPGEDWDIAGGIERLWRHMQEPSYRAYRELQSAARTDPALREIMDTLSAEIAQRRYDQAAARYLPFVTADRDAFVAARAFTTIFLEGLSQHSFGSADTESTPARQLDLLVELLTDFWSRHGVSSPRRGPQVQPDQPDALEAISRHAEAILSTLRGLAKGRV